MVYPKEGLPCWLDNYSIAYTIKKDTILYKIAHDYINEVIDPKYQTEHILRNLSLSTSVMKFSDKLTKEEKRRVLSKDPLSFNKACFMTPTLTTRERLGIMKIWKQVLKSR